VLGGRRIEIMKRSFVRLPDIKTLILLGWFFGFRIPHPQTEGAVFNFMVGPFTNELICKSELDYAVDYFSMRLGEPSAVIQCTERKEA